MKYSRKFIILTGSLAVAAILTGSAFGIPAVTSDGTENYTGVKLDAAHKALDWDASTYSPNIIVPFTKAHVNSIKQTASEETNGSDLRCNIGPDDPAFYSVTIKRVGLFGITMAETTYRICDISG